MLIALLLAAIAVLLASTLLAGLVTVAAWAFGVLLRVLFALVKIVDPAQRDSG